MLLDGTCFLFISFQELNVWSHSGRCFRPMLVLQILTFSSKQLFENESTFGLQMLR